MGQHTSGIRSILTLPVVYDALQCVMGGKALSSFIVSDYIKPQAGINLLDIGCGPAAILEHLPPINYWGFDASRAYIDMARKKYGERGQFYCRQVEELELGVLPKFDRVLALGVLHHLSDKSARALVDLAFEALTPGGFLITMDPCFVPGQNPIARFLIGKDRGQNVRDRAGYETLVTSRFINADISVQHQSWIPYTRCITRCTR